MNMKPWVRFGVLCMLGGGALRGSAYVASDSGDDSEHVAEAQGGWQ